MKAVYKRRLLKLADFLERLPRKRFNYGHWCSGDASKGLGKPEDVTCGTTACALGWATAIPAFRRLGLRMRFGRFGGTIEWAPNGVVVGWHYAAGFFLFGLGTDGFRHLFYPMNNNLGSKATPKQVAKHIRKFVARDGVLP